MSSETTIGVVFGFDDVLAPDSTTFLLEQHGEDPETFWSETFRDRVADGYDPTTAYLTALLERIGTDEPLGELTVAELEAIGAALDDHLYDGVGGLLSDLREIAGAYSGTAVECFVVSEGLAPILRGSSVADDCTAVYGSELATDEDSVVSEVKRPISFTDKTRCLFEINKGIEQSERRENPYAVNDAVERSERAIRFDEMIYVGDGITDVPCFSLVKERNGRVFGVYDDGRRSPKQRVARELGARQRVERYTEPRYTESSRLGSLLRLTVEGLCAERAIEKREAL